MNCKGPDIDIAYKTQDVVATMAQLCCFTPGTCVRLSSVSVHDALFETFPLVRDDAFGVCYG